METLPPDPILLVAVDPARNIRRCWHVCVSRDLFGHVLVETGWGRIGTRGQTKVHSFASEAEARRHLCALLARRGLAITRLGVAYRPA